jgi:hypothetical protein
MKGRHCVFSGRRSVALVQKSIELLIKKSPVFAFLNGGFNLLRTAGKIGSFFLEFL